MIAVIYKPGYTRIDNTEATRKGIDMMTRSQKKGQERIRELERIYAPLNCPREEDRKLARLYAGLFEEANSHMHSPADAMAVERALYIYETAEFGDVEADRRARERQERRSTQRR